MPTPSVRSKIAGVGSILDFASKRKHQIAVLLATLMLMAALVTVSAEHKTALEDVAKVKTALEDVGKVWPCAKAPDLFGTAADIEAAARGDIEAAARGDIEAAVRDIEPDIEAAIEAARDLKDDLSSCKKAVEMAKKAVEKAKKVAAKYRLPEKEAPDLVERAEHDLVELADHDSQFALKVFGAGADVAR